MELSVNFVEVLSEGGQGSWHSWSPLLSRRMVWETSQELLAGIQVWARLPAGLAQSSGSHPPPTHVWRGRPERAQPRSPRVGLPLGGVAQVRPAVR